VIRWEEQDDGDWHGLSGDLVVARVAKAAGGGKTRWTWQMQGIERPPGWRISGHRATVLAARASGTKPLCLDVKEKATDGVPPKRHTHHARAARCGL
jgi:hypothetical protein